MKTSTPVLLIAIVAAAVSCGQRKSDVDIRVDSILRQMTLSEKIGQMNQISVGGEVSNYAAQSVTARWAPSSTRLIP